MNAVHFLPQRKIKCDFGDDFRVGMIRSKLLRLPPRPPAAGLSIQRETNRIQQTGFTAAGGAVNEEKRAGAQLREIEQLHTRVGTKGMNGQPQRFHENSFGSLADCMLIVLVPF